jgi:hypothetical protein
MLSEIYTREESVFDNEYIWTFAIILAEYFL